ncbi:MAG: RNA polymerase sigma factor [Candidatus Nanopelagicales bacterium]
MGWTARARRDALPQHDFSAWVAAAQAGDKEAFGWIWQALAPRVNGYLRGRGVGSPDDVTSEVFLAAFTQIEGFTGDGAAFRSWLFTIAHHKAVDVLRRKVDVAEYTPESDPRLAASAEQDALDEIVDEDVRAMLAGLTPEQREVLLLRTLGDLSVEQVAEATGRSIGAVKQLHHRAVAAARRAAEDRTAQVRVAEDRGTPDRPPARRGAPDRAGQGRPPDARVRTALEHP